MFRKHDEIMITYVGHKPREVYCIDLIPDLVKTSFGNTQIVVCVDKLSKFVILGALPNREELTIAAFLY